MNFGGFMQVIGRLCCLLIAAAIVSAAIWPISYTSWAESLREVSREDLADEPVEVVEPSVNDLDKTELNADASQATWPTPLRVVALIVKQSLSLLAPAGMTLLVLRWLRRRKSRIKLSEES